MPSSSKTERLRLNVWSLTDRPHMADFNADNTAIDTAFSEHTQDTVAHMSPEEHSDFTNRVSFAYYFGTNAHSRTLQLPFAPQFVIVFAADKAPFTFAGGVGSCYCGFASQEFKSDHISLDGSVLTIGYENLKEGSAELNKASLGYVVVLFK